MQIGCDATTSITIHRGTHADRAPKGTIITLTLTLKPDHNPNINPNLITLQTLTDAGLFSMHPEIGMTET